MGEGLLSEAIMPIFWVSLCCLTLLFVQSRKADAYPETHYRFAPGLSILFRRRPEILFDAPHRVTRGSALPVALLIKDAHCFPVEILAVDAAIIPDGGEPLPCKIHWEREMPGKLAVRFWWNLGYIDAKDLPIGDLRIVCRIHYRCRSRNCLAITDNFPGLSHQPLKVLVADQPWPRIPGWHYGDPHCHSDKTMDQVEFGAPVPVLAQMAEALGLDWFVVTDHSYDLDVPPFEHFGLDPELRRWHELEREVEQHTGRPIAIRGEEISCGNVQDHNVHLLVYGHPQLIPGRGDGAKRGLNLSNAPDLNMAEVLDQLSNAVTFAAHPDSGASWLERLILNRNKWTDEDRLKPDGLQVWNTRTGTELEAGLEQWVRMLLEGHRKPILAGSDAHGDFNRARCVLMPFLVLSEFEASFGVPRTCARVEGRLNRTSLLQSLRRGQTVLTDGALAIMSAHTSGSVAAIGDCLRTTQCELRVQARSTAEFGLVDQIVIHQGILGKAEHQYTPKFQPGYEVDVCHSIDVPESGYVRLEVHSQREGRRHRCITNPIWLESPLGLTS